MKIDVLIADLFISALLLMCNLCISSCADHDSSSTDSKFMHYAEKEEDSDTDSEELAELADFADRKEAETKRWCTRKSRRH